MTELRDSEDSVLNPALLIGYTCTVGKYSRLGTESFELLLTVPRQLAGEI